MSLLSVNIKKALDTDELNTVMSLLNYLSSHSNGTDADKAGMMKNELAAKNAFSRKELSDIEDLMYKAGELMLREKAKQGELLDPSFAASVMELINRIRDL